MAKAPSRVALIVVGFLVAAVVVLVAAWDWNWFRPMAEARASAALGRPVSIANLRVKLGWKPVLIAEGVQIANPDGSARFADITRLTVVADARASWRERTAVLPDVVLDQPVIEGVQDEDGRANWDFPTLAAPTLAAKSAAPGKPPQIGNLRITEGRAHIVSAKMRTDMNFDISTRDAGDGQPEQILVVAKGSYARQPITGGLAGGALLSLRDASTPYPIDLHIENGPTKVSLTGTVQDPLSFAGANLKLDLQGTDMQLLLPLTGIPIPPTPPYRFTGQLDYADRQINFSNFKGRLGSSDMGGTLSVDPTAPRLTVAGEISSTKVDLADLGGFIGSQPGRADTPGQTAQQKRDIAAAEASPRLLPTTRIDIGKLRSTDVHVKYRAGQILGRSMPLDKMVAKLDIEDGHITLAPLSFGVGSGAIKAQIDLTPVQDTMRTKALVDFDRLDLGRMLNATNIVKGGGVVRGRANVDATGSSLAEILGNGDGAVTVFTSGGDVSSLLVDLSGLQFGRALLSALGMPTRVQINCAVADFALQKGVLNTRTVLVDTPSSVIVGGGSINLRTETLAMALKTDAKQLTVGTLPAPIAITGPFKDPSIMPDIAALGLRGGAVAGLGVLFPPAAILPTIQFGVGENDACARLFGPKAAPRK
jgi:uncharacterized protein involved in outer membrane biogenesis